MFNKDFSGIVDLLQHFNSEEKCIAHLEELYWQGVPVSPFVDGSKVYKCKNNRYRCKESGKYFTVLNNTMFAGTKIGLQKWFAAIYLVLNHKKGISSLQLARALGGIPQKTAWYMLMRIRAALGIENYNEMEGTVEADETFYGGKNKNRHNDKKVKNSQGRSFKDKTPVLGLLERETGKITAVVIPTGTGATTIQPIIKKYVKPHTTFISDDWKGYLGLENRYNQYMIKHTTKGMRYSHPNPEIHTNGIEGVWKIFV